MRLSFASTVLVSSLLVPVVVTADGLDADYVGETLQIFETTGDANQGVAVDDKYIYAVTNRRITKMDKETGEVSHTMCLNKKKRLYIAREERCWNRNCF